MAKYTMIVGVVFILSSCASTERQKRNKTAITGAKTTFDLVLLKAIAGDAEYQNLLGYMFAFGEETEVDQLEAHHWFHTAAAAGHPLAQRNDAHMHQWLDADSKDVQAGNSSSHIQEIPQRQLLSSGISKKNSIAKTNEKTIVADDGHVTGNERNYVIFCGGCHGFNGIAAFAPSPSFALNERLQKSDAELMQNVSLGIGACPSWSGILPDQDLLGMIVYIRTLSRSYEMGIAHSPKEAPANYFLFGMQSKDFTDL